MLHDRIASTVQLARARLTELDRSAPETVVATPTYRLFLETLIELGSAPANQKLADSAARAVMGRVTEISEAERRRGN